MNLPLPNPHKIEIIAPNLNRRLSGVTATIVRLVPIQMKKIGIVSFGLGLPQNLPRLSFRSLIDLGNHPTQNQKPRIWHARRNVEALLGLVMKRFHKHKLKLVFTSASQRHHTAYSRFLIRQMDHVIATSAATAKYLKVKNTVIHHGIDLTKFAPTENKAEERQMKNIPGEFVIGCFGRIRKQKGTDVFVDAMIELLPDHPKATAIIMGRATLSHSFFLARLKAKIKRAGLEDRILFPGEVPVDQIADWYKMLNLFVAPQRWEGFGLTPIEAMACAVPVIATRVGAFPELIDENTSGRLVETGNPHEIAQAAKTYLNDEIMAQEQAKNALSHVNKNFPIEREADRIIEVYRALQDGKTLPS